MVLAHKVPEDVEPGAMTLRASFYEYRTALTHPSGRRLVDCAGSRSSTRSQKGTRDPRRGRASLDATSRGVPSHGSVGVWTGAAARARVAVPRRTGTEALDGSEATQRHCLASSRASR